MESLIDQEKLRTLAAVAGIDKIEHCSRNDDGWDSTVFEVNSEWIIRVPRRPEVAKRLRGETELVNAVGSTLPVPIPRLRLLDLDHKPFVAYRKLEGAPITLALSQGVEPGVLASRLGSFLAALHSFRGERAQAVGIQPFSVAEWRTRQRAFAGRCCTEVYPLLESAEREQAEAIFAVLDDVDGVAFALVHADLGPAHILCQRGQLTGVIDWSDAQAGDPAIDFAWAMHGTSSSFAAALRSAYLEAGAMTDDRFWSRAAAYHQQGPWHEVLYGLDEHRPELVRSGLEGVRKRLTLQD